jgi:hypothetical protein
MFDQMERRRADDEALEAALAGDKGDMLDWLIGGDHHADRHAVAAAPSGEESRSIDQIALAVAAGALPLSELRRALERPSETHLAQGGPCEGGEDVGCGSFLDRYLGAGVEPTFEDALELFPPRSERTR